MSSFAGAFKHMCLFREKELAGDLILGNKATATNTFPVACSSPAFSLEIQKLEANLLCRCQKACSSQAQCQFYLFGKTSVARHSGGFLFPLSNGDPLKSRFVGDALLSSLCRDV